MDCGVENRIVSSLMINIQGQEDKEEEDIILKNISIGPQQSNITEDKNVSFYQSPIVPDTQIQDTTNPNTTTATACIASKTIMDSHLNQKSIQQSSQNIIPLISTNLIQDTQTVTTPRNMHFENQTQLISYKALKAVMKEKHIKSAQNTPKNRAADIATLSDFHASLDEQQQQQQDNNNILESSDVGPNALQYIHSQPICASTKLLEKYHLQKSQEMRLKSDQIARELDQIQQKVRSDSAIFAQWKKSQEDSLPSSSSLQLNNAEPLAAPAGAAVTIGVGVLPIVSDSPYHSQGQSDLLSERTYNKKSKKQQQQLQQKQIQTPSQSSSQTEEYFNKEPQQVLGVPQLSMFSNTNGKTNNHSIFLSERLKEELKSTRIADYFVQDKRNKDKYQNINIIHESSIPQDNHQKNSQDVQFKSAQNIPTSSPLSSQNIPKIINKQSNTRHSLSHIDNGRYQTQEQPQTQDNSEKLSLSPQLIAANKIILAPQAQQMFSSNFNLNQEQPNDSQTCLAMIRQNIQEISDAFDKYSKRSLSAQNNSNNNNSKRQTDGKLENQRIEKILKDGSKTERYSNESNEYRIEQKQLEQEIIKKCQSQKNQKLQIILNNNNNNKSCNFANNIGRQQSPNSTEQKNNTDRLGITTTTIKNDRQLIDKDCIYRNIGTERSPSNENTTSTNNTNRSNSARKSILRQTALDAKLRMERVAKRQVHALEKLEMSRQASRSPKKDSSSQLITPRNHKITATTSGGQQVIPTFRERDVGISYKYNNPHTLMISHNHDIKGMNSQRRGSSPMSRIEDTQNELFAMKINDGIITPRTSSKGNMKSFHFTGNIDRNISSSNSSRLKQSNNKSSCKSNQNNSNNISSEKVASTHPKKTENMQILVIPANQNNKSVNFKDISNQQHYQENNNNIICPTLLTRRTSNNTVNYHKNQKTQQLQLDSPSKNIKHSQKYTDTSNNNINTAKQIFSTANFLTQSITGSPSQYILSPQESNQTTPRVIIQSNAQEYLITSKTPRTSTHSSSNHNNSNKFFSSVKTKQNSNIISSSKLNSNQIAKIIDSKGIKCNTNTNTTKESQGDYSQYNLIKQTNQGKIIRDYYSDNSQKLREAVTKAIEKSTGFKHQGLKITDNKEKKKEEGIENQCSNANRQNKDELLLNNGGMAQIMQKYQPIERNAQVDYDNQNQHKESNKTGKIVNQQQINEKQKELMRAMYYRREISIEKNRQRIEQGQQDIETNRIKRIDYGQELEGVQGQKQIQKRKEESEGIINPIDIISPNCCEEQYPISQAQIYYQPFKVKENNYQTIQQPKDNRKIKDFSFQKP